MRVIKVPVGISETVDRFNAALKQLETYVFGRTIEIRALALCLLTKQHLLLEGDPGLAKSRFALLGFRIFRDARLFRLMLHGQSSTDEIFGPPNPKILRERGILRFNSTGMLPRAHFAYLDELFNGPGAVLNSTLNILNERHWMNGGVPMACPLITAVATTNNVSAEREMAALVDRFLICRRVQPADSAAARSSVISAFLGAESVDDIELSETLTLDDLRSMQEAVKTIKVGQPIYDILENLRTSHVAAFPESLISDRRFCWLYRTIQASIFMHTGGKSVNDPPIDALMPAVHVLARNQQEVNVLEQALATSVTQYQQSLTEERELTQLETKMLSSITEFETNFESWPLPKARKRFAMIREAYTKLGALAPAQQFSGAGRVARLERLLQKTNEFLTVFESKFNGDDN